MFFHVVSEQIPGIYYVAIIRVVNHLKSKGNIRSHYYQVPEYNDLQSKIYLNLLGNQVLNLASKCAVYFKNKQ